MLYSLIAHFPILLQALCVFLLSSFLSAFFAPFLIFFLKKKKWGQSIRELGPKSHLSKQGTPTMGGLIFILPPFFAALLFLPLNNLSFLITLFTFLTLAFLGFTDDFLKLQKRNHTGVKPSQKIFFQLVISCLAGIGVYSSVGGNIYVPFHELPLANIGVWIVPWTMFIIISWSNSVNLSDGLDGLAGGLCVIALVPLAVLGLLESGAHRPGSFLPHYHSGYVLSLFLLAIIGSLFVFLWFNGLPAQIFMGDTGSMALGGLLGICSVLLKAELIVAFLGLIFILESLSVIIQVGYYKISKGKRFFRMAPIHHHFEQAGVPENKIVLRAWLIQTGIAAITVLVILYKRL